jgi:hypothetical protein
VALVAAAVEELTNQLSNLLLLAQLAKVLLAQLEFKITEAVEVVVLVLLEAFLMVVTEQVTL